MPGGSARENGFALLLVLIALATLSVIAAAIVDSARRYSARAEARIEEVQVRAALDAALATAADELSDAGAQQIQLLSHRETIAVGSVFATIAVRPESAKIDLNAAPLGLIKSLLLSSGENKDAATKLADEIADWRDADSEVHPHGAEAGDYLAAGRSYTPANAPFGSESELALLLSGSSELAQCLAPVVTVFTGRTDVDAAAASPRVRKALGLEDAPGAPASGAISALGSVPSGALFEIDVTVLDGDRRGSRQTILRATGDPKRPVWVLAQSSPIPSEPDALASCKRLKRAKTVKSGA